MNRFYIKFNIIRKFICQMINYLLFQIVKWNNVVLIVGNSYWEYVGKLISDILQEVQISNDSILM